MGEFWGACETGDVVVLLEASSDVAGAVALDGDLPVAVLDEDRRAPAGRAGRGSGRSAGWVAPPPPRTGGYPERPGGPLGWQGKYETAVRARRSLARKIGVLRTPPRLRNRLRSAVTRAAPPGGGEDGQRIAAGGTVCRIVSCENPFSTPELEPSETPRRGELGVS